MLNVTAAVQYMIAPKGTNLKKLDVSWNGAKKMIEPFHDNDVTMPHDAS